MNVAHNSRRIFVCDVSQAIKNSILAGSRFLLRDRGNFTNLRCGICGGLDRRRSALSECACFTLKLADSLPSVSVSWEPNRLLTYRANQHVSAVASRPSPTRPAEPTRHTEIEPCRGSGRHDLPEWEL